MRHIVNDFLMFLYSKGIVLARYNGPDVPPTPLTAAEVTDIKDTFK